MRALPHRTRRKSLNVVDCRERFRRAGTDGGEYAANGVIDPAVLVQSQEKSVHCAFEGE